MDLSSRYEIVDTIATGDFAVVYRARDRELGREVAIKQIHQQFLSDERQLARYWQEAQLLASLQHPNVLTIYDIVRPRGWLILELMRGSLRQSAEKQPIDLDFLRTAMVGCLGALQFLHTNGVIHGDVKPSNMLIDSQNRVKLGDFGLARRASNEEGSLLKGTTKYMAPELVSPQFGAVGPASDLYSLGFSAYELMCGPQFDSLFPTLHTFGRDKQIAWMMWHAAADQNLPEIGRVLEGVPDDLARVVQKLVVKDQARRYQSARAVLGDLKYDPAAIDQPPEEEDAEAIAAAAAEAKRKQRLRFAAVLAVAFSFMLCVAMLLPERKAPVATEQVETHGRITNLFLDEDKIELELTDGTIEERKLRQGDIVFIDGVKSSPRHLRPGDKVSVKVVDGVTYIYAFRHKADRGLIKAVHAGLGRFTLTIGEGDQKKDLVVTVPSDLKIEFNKNRGIIGRPVTLRDLKPDDRVVLHHEQHHEKGEENVRVATELSVERVVFLEGTINDVDMTKGEAGQLTVKLHEGGEVTLPFAPGGGCVVTINGWSESREGQKLKPANLQTRDQVKVDHDSQVVRVDAYRIFRDSGAVQRVDYDDNRLVVLVEEENKRITYHISEKCKLTLDGRPVKLTDLRGDDTVEITHDSYREETRKAMEVAAQRLADRTRRAILIANQNYDDKSLTRLDFPVADATLLGDVLVRRYRVPADQAETLTDENRQPIRDHVIEQLEKTAAGDSLIVFFSGHAYKDDEGTVYLAPKEFELKQMSTTGLSLQWLVDELEKCAAKEKLLLLDCSHAGEGADLAMQPSTAEMIRTLQVTPGRSPFRTIAAIASCRAGQRGLVWTDEGHGLFPWLLSEGYSGRADKNRDNRLKPTELFEFLKREMAAASEQLEGTQTPELFSPDPRPPRLSEEAKQAIRKLAANLRKSSIDYEEVGQQYADAARLADKQPEPKLLYGLLLLRNSRLRDEALAHLEELKIEYPDLLLPLRAMVWLKFQKRSYEAGIRELRELIAKVPKPKKQPKKPADPYPARAQQIFEWAGRLREFAATAAKQEYRPSPESPAALDASVKAHGSQADEPYQKGRARSGATAQEFDRQIAFAEDAEDEATVARLKVERHRLVHYATFPFDDLAQRILAGLDQ